MSDARQRNNKQRNFASSKGKSGSRSEGAVQCLMPEITSVTNESVQKYVGLCDSLVDRGTGYLSCVCLICSKDGFTFSNVDVHLESANHESVSGALCFLCNAFLITKKNNGFEAHLKSAKHQNVVRFRPKQRGNKIGVGKEIFSLVEQGMDKLNLGRNRVTRNSDERNRDERNSDENLDEWQTENWEVVPEEPVELDNQQWDPFFHSDLRSKISELRSKITFKLEGRLTYSFMEVYSELNKFGHISFLGLRPNGNTAYVTYDPLISHINLGNMIEIEKIKKPEELIQGIKQDGEWIKWDSIFITPECQDVFSFKGTWERHMIDVWKKSDNAINMFDNLKEMLIKSIKDSLGQAKVKATAVCFYGSCLTYLMDDDDYVYIHLEGTQRNDINKLVDTLEKKSKDFSILKEKRKCLSFNGILKCILTDGKDSLLNFETSLIVRTLTFLDESVRWLLLTIREWWKLNDPHRLSSLSTNQEILDWLVLFYLINHGKIIPSVELLHYIGADEEDLLEGQKTPFSTNVETIASFHREQYSSFKRRDFSQYLVAFMMFYNRISLYGVVLCPLSGSYFSRVEFLSNALERDRLVLQNQPFIMVHPLNTEINLLSYLTKKDYFFFAQKLKSTLAFMTSIPPPPM